MIGEKLKNMKCIKGGAVQMFALLALWVTRKHIEQKTKEVSCDDSNLCIKTMYKTPKPCSFDLNRRRRYS